MCLIHFEGYLNLCRHGNHELSLPSRWRSSEWSGPLSIGWHTPQQALCEHPCSGFQDLQWGRKKGAMMMRKIPPRNLTSDILTSDFLQEVHPPLSWCSESKSRRCSLWDIPRSAFWETAILHKRLMLWIKCLGLTPEFICCNLSTLQCTWRWGFWVVISSGGGPLNKGV